MEDADLIDAAVIFGTGFAPFRGGPLAYARARGVAAVVRAAGGTRQAATAPASSRIAGWHRRCRAGARKTVNGAPGAG